MDRNATGAKIVMAAAWGWGITCAFRPDLPYAGAGVAMVKAFAVIHLVEMLIFYRRIRATGESVFLHLVQIFFFGVFHMRGVR